MSTATDTYAEITGIHKAFHPPREPLSLLLRLREELARMIGHALQDSGIDGTVPINWLRDTAELLQIELPPEDDC